MRARTWQIQECYDAGFHRNITLTGRITTRFLVELDGTVAWAVLDDTDLPDGQVVNCVEAVFGGR